MSEFQKAKVGFALALLGAVFALHPFVAQYNAYGFELLTVMWTVGGVYTTFAALLGAAVYIFAIDFAIHRPLPWVQSAGNLVYVVALTVAPAYGVLFLGHVLIGLVSPLLDSELFNTALQGAVGGIVGFLSVTVVKAVRNRLASSERSSAASQYDKEEAGHIDRASHLHRAGYSDMAILEAFRAIEVALRAAYLREGNAPSAGTNIGSLIRWAIANEIVPKSAKGGLDEIRIARNSIAHGEADISGEQADVLLKEARDVLSEIRRFEERASEDTEFGESAQQSR